ncbi:MAG: glycine cleavage system protein GcvH [Candidatus Heimdallarchaeaceae archaeon]
MADEVKVADKYVVRMDCMYTEQHEWIRKVDDIYFYGVSDYAQKELGELAYVEFPEVGDTFSKGDEMGTIEALKTVAEYYAPVDCEIVEVNSALDEDAGIINQSPYDDGWILKLKANGPVEGLLTPEEYIKLIEKEIEH